MEKASVQNLLRTHARTFAITLGLLPRALREPLSLAYLLARASDTIADSRRIPQALRLQHLEELGEMLASGGPVRWNPKIEIKKLVPEELELLDLLPELLGLLDLQKDRAEIAGLWLTILKGQCFDLQRFTPGSQSLSGEELEHYCWLVAGSVGETWTRLLDKNTTLLSHLTAEEREWVTTCGINYGKGLQLLNILRDRAEDWKLGRKYLPDGDVDEMVQLTARWLDQGRRYCERLAPGRIRYATELPLRLALKTLGRIKSSPDATRVKIPQWEVALALTQALPSLVLRKRANPAS